VRSALGRACKLELNQNTNSAAFFGGKARGTSAGTSALSYPLLSISPARAEEAFKEAGL